MSTKAIAEALRMLRAAVPADGGIVEKAVDAAQDELNAIRAACQRIASGHLRLRSFDDEDTKHMALLDAIGEEAP